MIVDKNIVLDKRDLYMNITPFTMTNGDQYHYVWWYFKDNVTVKYRKLCIERKEVDNLLSDLAIHIQSRMFL
jgi:hypothetical protein